MTTSRKTLWIKANPERHKAALLARKLKPDYFARALLRKLGSRCRKSGLELGLTLEDIVVPSHCPVLGIPLIKTIGKGTRTDNTPSIDRVDNSRGYVQDNIVIISWRANRLKSDATVDELRRISKYYGKKAKRSTRS